MYQPPHFREDRIDVLQDLVRAHPLAALVAMSQDGLIANHLPMILHCELSEKGTLRGHVSRANPLWKAFDAEVDALAIFQGPESYITPSWYASKKEHGKVVPTWNYAVVHAHGPLRILDDAQWLRAHLDVLTHQQERTRPVPWELADAPADFVERQLKGIVGIELPISRIEGKWKVSQNRADRDRMGVHRGLQLESGGAASALSELVERYGRQGDPDGTI